MNMHRKWFVAALAAILFLAGILAAGGVSPNAASPERLYRNNSEIDLFVYKDTAYVYAADVDWVKELEWTPDVCVGSIQRTNITRRFRDFDATRLHEGTEIYSAKERPDFLIVCLGSEILPYHRYAEG